MGTFHCPLFQPPPQESWNGELLGYVVTWREAGSLEPENATQALTAAGWAAAQALIAALRPHAHYEVRVCAFNAVGAGPTAPPLTATTLEGGLCFSALFIGIFIDGQTISA
jgi:hypothetical protein